MQDFKAAGLVSRVRDEARLYLLEDPEQCLYADREDVDIPNAVTVWSTDNFRSPRQVVGLINLLGLTQREIRARSPWEGDAPGVHEYGPLRSLLRATESAVQSCLDQGYAIDDIAVVSYRGAKSSSILANDSLGPWRLRKFSGKYGTAGEPLWTEGELLADTVR